MVSGIVSDVVARQWQNKTFFSLEVNGQQYGTGTIKPKVNKGDYVEFETVKNKKGYEDADIKTLKVTERSEQVSNGASAGALPMSKDDYFRSKDTRAVEQDKLRSQGASRNTALEWIKFLVSQEALALPKANNKKEDFFNGLLTDYTLRFMTGTDLAVDPVPTPDNNKKEEIDSDADSTNWTA